MVVLVGACQKKTKDVLENPAADNPSTNEITTIPEIEETKDTRIQDSIAVDSGVPPKASIPEVAQRVMVSFKKTPCFGHCPVFEVRFYNDGYAIYKGDRFVDKLGVYQSNIDSFQINSILEKAQEIQFFDLADEYPESGRRIPDLPSTIIYLNDGKQDKKVIDNHNAPIALISFQNYLQTIVDKLDWKLQESDNE